MSENMFRKWFAIYVLLTLEHLIKYLFSAVNLIVVVTLS